jgi:hypothetical protein
VQRHLLSTLVCLGRHTLTGHIATAGRQDVDWSADYRLYSKGRVDTEALFAPLRTTIVNRLDPKQPVVVSMDDTRLKKSSRKTPGVKYTRDPLGPSFHVNFILAQRFIQTSMAWPNQEGQARMIPIDFTHAPTADKPKKDADEEAWKSYRQAQREKVLGKVGQQRLHALRQALDEEHKGRERSLVCVVDGGYTNRTFLKDLPQRTCVIGRIRGDAKLYHLPEEQAPTGRRRIYGDGAPTPEQLRQDDTVPWRRIPAHACGKRHLFRIKTLCPLRWRATSDKCTLRLVVIAPLRYRLSKKAKALYRKPAYLICTDPDMPLEALLQYYLWRWDIEVNFRDEKSLLGVGQAQVHHTDSVRSVPALSVASYAILLTAALNLYGLDGNAIKLCPPKWQRYTPPRASAQKLIAQLRNDLWGDAIRLSHFGKQSPSKEKSRKDRPPIDAALFYGASRA